MGSEEREELTDVVLCYQAMGLALDATPPEVERTFKSVSDKYREIMLSPDLSLREQARQNLALVEEMHVKIKNSITYRSVENAHLKAGEQSTDTSQLKRPPHPAAAERRMQVQCPRCNATIAMGTRVCPTCRATIYTTMEKIMRAMFTPRKLILYAVIVVVASAVVLRMTHPEIFPGNKSVPEIDFGDKDK